MLAYYLEWHMRRALAPLLFDDDDKPSAAARRPSPWPRRSDRTQPSQGSHQAHRRARPVHSFRTLLADLATIVRNRLQPKDASAPPFEILTTPTPLQQRAFDLLGVPVRL